MLTLGVIADDFTGATDVANNLVRGGMRVVQTIGLPSAPVHDADVVVVALKSRTAPVAEAVADSLAAARWLQAQGARQLYFKVCSTFDSTPQGNIGPVTEALMAHLSPAWVPVTPAFPENGRSVFMGHLFVGQQLLSESSMRQHPLTPMTDSNLMRVLQAQCGRERVALIEHAHVARGADAIAQRAHELVGGGTKVLIVDTADDAALGQLAKACVAPTPLSLIVAASGLAQPLAQEWGFRPSQQARTLPPPHGAAAIVSGSCSTATRGQIADFLQRGGQGFRIDPMALAASEGVVASALDWARARLGDAPVLVYSDADPQAVARAQAALGAGLAGEMMERALAAVARGLVARGVGKLVVAGGETSGACVQALGVRMLRIGQQIAPGVPWCFAAAEDAKSAEASPGLHIALKSGNFGGLDFFSKAFSVLQHGQ